MGGSESVECFGSDREPRPAWKQFLEFAEITCADDDSKGIGRNAHALPCNGIVAKDCKLLPEAALVLQFDAPPARLELEDARFHSEKMSQRILDRDSTPPAGKESRIVKPRTGRKYGVGSDPFSRSGKCRQIEGKKVA